MLKKQKISEKQQTSKSTASNELIKKQVVAPWAVDRDPLKEEWLDRNLTGMLTQHYNVGRIYFYEDWKELVDKHAQLPIYQELCWEFHSTYILKENPKNMDDKEFMRFKLDGVDRQMSLMDFTRCLQIYSPEQMGEKHFSDYIWLGARVSAEEDFNADKIWKEISKSGSTWSPGQVSCSDIDVVGFRLFHLVLTHNITHRTEGTDKVSLHDLWFLQNKKSKNRVNIPYCVAYYLKHWATGVDPNSPICGGHYVTLIAHHLGVKCDAFDEELLERSSIGVSEYYKAKVLSQPVQEKPIKTIQTPYTTEYTALELLTWLTNLELMYKEPLSDRNKLEKLHQEWNLSKNIGLLLEQIDEIEKVKNKYSQDIDSEENVISTPEIEPLVLVPTASIHDIVTWMKELKMGLEYTLRDKNEMLRLQQQQWTLTEYLRQISDRLAGFKDFSRIKLAEIQNLSKNK